MTPVPCHSAGSVRLQKHQCILAALCINTQTRAGLPCFGSCGPNLQGTRAKHPKLWTFVWQDKDGWNDAIALSGSHNT